MKRLLCVLMAIGIIATTTFADVAINETTFPDDNFRAWALAQDFGSDEILTIAEIDTIKVIDVSSMNIVDLKGIEYFVALTELICFYNELTSLDVSNNPLLVNLVCWNNLLTSLDLSNNTALKFLNCSSNQLESLDLSNNTELTHLYCGNNQLTELNVSNNTALTTLQCGSNKYTSLDLSNNTMLDTLVFPASGLTSVDVSNNTKLKYFLCFLNGLTELDVSNNTALEFMDCSYNLLTELDLSKNIALTWLACHHNEITSLDVSNNAALTSLNCDSNKLTSLDVSKSTLLTTLVCLNNQLTYVDLSANTVLTAFVAFAQTPTITLYGNNNNYRAAVGLYNPTNFAAGIEYITGVYADNVLTSNNSAIVSSSFDADAKGFAGIGLSGTMNFVYEEAIFIDEINFPDDNFRAWALAQDFGSDGVLTNAEIAEITRIAVWNLNIEDLTGIEYFTELTYLNCSSNKLTSVNVSNNTKLDSLSLDYNQLTSLDVSNNTALVYLSCSGNLLGSIDVSKNTSLEYLGVYSTQLSSIDVSKNLALKELSCGSNQLTEIDVSKNLELTGLYCLFNQLTELDLSKNLALTDLVCHFNQLTELDVTKNTALTQLVFFNNKISEIDLSHNTAIKQLYVANNKLTSLDLTGITLTYWDGGANQSPTLGLSKNNGDYSLAIELNNPAPGAFEPGISYDGEKLTSNSNGISSSFFAIEIKGFGGNYLTGTMNLLYGIPINEETFPDYNFRAWALAQPWGEDAFLTEDEVSGITEVIVSGMNIADLTGIEYFTEITLLSCGSNELSYLDVSKNTALITLACPINQLKELDVSNNSVLEYLYCADNQLIELDLSENTELKTLVCNNNELTSLNVSKNMGLKELYCYNNNLTELDVSANTELMYLVTHNNQLAELDVSNNTELKVLVCFNNKLTEFDVSNNPLLVDLECNDNHLTELDLSNNSLLTYFAGQDQTSMLTLLGSNENYNVMIGLNNPTSLVAGVTYDNGILTSNSNTISSSSFIVETKFAGNTLSGTLNFVYHTIGVDCDNTACGTTCSICGNAIADHNFIALGTLINEKTCTLPATHKAACVACGEEHVSDILTGESAAGHSFVWTETIAATCIANGEKLEVCSTCEAEGKTGKIWAIHDAHTFGEWTTIIAATCQAPGMQTKTCIHDSAHTQVQQIAKLTGEECATTPIIPNVKDEKSGIKFAKNIVNEKAEISVVLPEDVKAVEAKIIVYDAVGNIVFTTNVRCSETISWNLTNNAGRIIANGSYLVIAEVKGTNGMIYAYSAKLGVKR